jgi:hypothetical protein
LIEVGSFQSVQHAASVLPTEVETNGVALRGAIEMLAKSFDKSCMPFDIEVALFGLGYRFPSMSRDELLQSILDVLGERATPSREMIRPNIVAYRPKPSIPAVRQQVTWERKAG